MQRVDYARRAKAMREYAVAHPRETLKAIARRFDANAVTVSLILSGQVWQHAGGPIDPRNKCLTRGAMAQASLDDATAREVYRRVQADGERGACARVARRMGIPYDRVWQIANRQSYVWATANLWVKTRKGRQVSPPTLTPALTKLA